MPQIVLALASVLLVVNSWSPLTRILEYDRDAVAHGQVWRLLTGHMVHWSFEHALWNLAVLAVVTWICARRAPSLTLRVLAGSTALVGIAIHVISPVTTYRGLSGVTCGVYILAGALLLEEAGRVGDRLQKLSTWLLLAGFLLKILYEAGSGLTVFVASSGFDVVPTAHLAGAAAGIVGAGIHLMGDLSLTPALAPSVAARR